MAEHVQCFLPGGSYERLKLKQWAVIDFRVGDKAILKDRAGNDNLCHALFSKDFMKVTIKWGDSEDKRCFDLKGDEVVRICSICCVS